MTTMNEKRTIRVMLIDDEMLVRKLVRMKLDMEGIGLEIVGEYAGAEAALEDLETLQPDLILSDICMPDMDGIAFSEKCREILPEVRIIIVTGFNNFDYLRESLRVGVYDFLCKPIQSHELNAAVLRAAESIRLEESRNNHREQFLEEVRENLPALLELYINDVLNHRRSVDGIEAKLPEYGVELNPNPEGGLQMAVLSAAELLKDHNLASNMKMEGRSFFQEDSYVSVISDMLGRTVIISNAQEIPFEECIALLSQIIGEKYHCNVAAGISDRYDGYQDLCATYESALHAMQMEHGTLSIPAEQEGEMQKWKDLVQCITAGQPEEAADTWMELVEDWENRLPDEHIVSERRAIIGKLQKLCLDTGILKEHVDFEEQLQRCPNREMLEDLSSHVVMDMASIRAVEREPERGGIVTQILKDVKAHLSDQDLNMNRVAQEHHVSSSNLSRLFRQFMGRTYGECLSLIRLREALKLLDESDLYDRDIGVKVGIADQHYLSIWFRKSTGMSITEYRKKMAMIA